MASHKHEVWKFFYNHKRPVPIYSISFSLDIPEPSVRRIIHELRQEGWNIVTSSAGGNFRAYQLV